MLLPVPTTVCGSYFQQFDYQNNPIRWLFFQLKKMKNIFFISVISWGWFFSCFCLPLICFHVRGSVEIFTQSTCHFSRRFLQTTTTSLSWKIWQMKTQILFNTHSISQIQKQPKIKSCSFSLLRFSKECLVATTKNLYSMFDS